MHVATQNSNLCDLCKESCVCKKIICGRLNVTIQSTKTKQILAKSIAKVIRLGESNGKDIPYIIYWREVVIWSNSVCRRVTRVEVMIGICHGLFLGSVFILLAWNVSSTRGRLCGLSFRSIRVHVWISLESVLTKINEIKNLMGLGAKRLSFPTLLVYLFRQKTQLVPLPHLKDSY